MTKKQQPWMTVVMAAKYLGLDETTTAKLMDHTGLSRTLIANGPVIVLRKELDDYLAAAGIMAADQGKVVPMHQQQ